MFAECEKLFVHTKYIPISCNLQQYFFIYQFQLYNGTVTITRFNTIMNIQNPIFLIATYLYMAESANILGYLITHGRSHFIVADALMRGLAANGHNVK